ncbi:glycosyltransferase family 87 protein [Legionella sp.]|uniref:glycosyltransferase family 87 protein n=1 Tax=Legionella sp. TaxID=459 RepID=UPI002580391D|nr:glycosyltransferase family 87 protein [Legionella sp.]
MLVSFYVVLFYLMFSSDHLLDFHSFYFSSQMLAKGGNPYQVLSTIYFPTLKIMPANLNPPIVLWFLKPLTNLNYQAAVSIWILSSFILGLIGARIAFSYAFSLDYIKKNGFYLYFIYLFSFPTLMNTGLAQMGAILMFLLMIGYHFYMRKRDYFAAIVWGILIAIKFFPALLIVYTLVQKRYRVSIATLGVFLFLSLLPLCVYGTKIYTQYFSMMSQINWYGKSWNASILGLIYRLLNTGTEQNWILIKLIYGVLFSVFFILYLRKIIQIEKLKIKHQSFGLTLVMMLFLSPFGWLYYLPMLVFPLSLTWLIFLSEKQPLTLKFAWFFCLFFINIPINNLPLTMMPSLLGKLSYYSFNFYGLLILLYFMAFCLES